MEIPINIILEGVSGYGLMAHLEEPFEDILKRTLPLEVLQHLDEWKIVSFTGKNVKDIKLTLKDVVYQTNAAEFILVPKYPYVCPDC